MKPEQYQSIVVLNSNLIDILNRLRGSGKVHFVGGCVRDILLGKQPHDYDIVTSLRPDEIIALCPDMITNLVGKSFGVVVVNGYEIATFRKDIYSSDKFHSKGADSVEFANTIEEDLSRRDFTINAMAIQYTGTWSLPFGEIIDPYNGQRDIEVGVVRFVGNANERIKEDPCRMLRAMRFASQFNFHVPPGTMNAIDDNRVLFFLIAPERVRLEIMKVLERADKPSGFIEHLYMYDLLRYVFPSLRECYEIDGGIHHGETVYEHCLLAMDSIGKKYPLLRLAALLHDVGKPQTIDVNGHFYMHERISAQLARICLEHLKFSAKDIDYVCELVKRHMFYFEDVTKDSTYRRFMSKLNIPVRHQLRLRIADRRANLSKKDRPTITQYFRDTLRRIRRIEKEANCLKITDLEIDGRDLLEMGFEQGPTIGRVLNDCLALVIEHPGCNSKNVLKDFVGGLANGHK